MERLRAAERARHKAVDDLVALGVVRSRRLGRGGWADPSFPIKVYAKAVRRRERLSGAHREAFDAALQWAAMGSGADEHPSAGSTLVDNAVEETAS